MEHSNLLSISPACKIYYHHSHTHTASTNVDTFRTESHKFAHISPRYHGQNGQNFPLPRTAIVAGVEPSQFLNPFRTTGLRKAKKLQHKLIRAETHCGADKSLKVVPFNQKRAASAPLWRRLASSSGENQTEFDLF